MNLASPFRCRPVFWLLSVIALLVMCAPLLLGAAMMPPGVAGGEFLAAGVIGLGGLLFNEASDPAAPGAAAGAGGANEQEKTTIQQAIAAMENKTMPLGQRFEVALQALRGIDPTGQLASAKEMEKSLQESIAAKDAELATANDTLAKALRQIAAMEGDLRAAKDAKAAVDAELTTLKAKDMDLEKRAEAKAGEKLAALGHRSDALPVAGSSANDPGAKSDEDRIKELKGMDRVRAGLHFKEHGKLPDWVKAA